MKIYALVWGDLILYVGQTNASLKQRAASHRCSSNTACSKYIPDYMDWEIVLVDTVPDDEATKWEQYYYDELMPLYNKYRPGQTTEEWNKANGYASQRAYNKKTGYAHIKAYHKSEKGKAYSRAYYQANKEAYAKRQKEYRANK